MKLLETSDLEKTVRLGVVKLGTAVGKVKYALIDEVDIPIIHEYKFDARLEIDRNGDGLQVIAMGHPKSTSSLGSQEGPIPLQKILWESRNGPVEPGYQVCHLNGITMDNRVDNLTLVPEWVSKTEQQSILKSRCTEKYVWENQAIDVSPLDRGMDRLFRDEVECVEDEPGRNERKSDRRRGENTLYWKAITQLLSNETEHRNSSTTSSRSYYTTEGELITRDCPSFFYFECHYPPCTAIESEPREFAMCGRCQQARYCGRECQRDDWAVHRDHCTEVKRSKRRGGHRERSHRGCADR